MRRKILLGCGLAIGASGIALFAIYGYILFHPPDLMYVPPSVLKSDSVAGLGTAAFLREEAFSNYSVYFYSFDATTGSQPVLIGGPYASDGNAKMQNAIWSQDGSIVAVRAKVGEPAGHGFSQYYGEFFVAAYDFRQHKAIGSGKTTCQKSQLIKKLIKQRGGPGRVALASPNVFMQNQEISEQEAQQYKH